jgi:hypothetical protein
MQIFIFNCQWVKHLNDMSVDNHSLILVDLKNVGHQDDTCVLADCVIVVFMYSIQKLKRT